MDRSRIGAPAALLVPLNATSAQDRESSGRTWSARTSTCPAVRRFRCVSSSRLGSRSQRGKPLVELAQLHAVRGPQSPCRSRQPALLDFMREPSATHDLWSMST